MTAVTINNTKFYHTGYKEGYLCRRKLYNKFDSDVKTKNKKQKHKKPE